MKVAKTLSTVRQRLRIVLTKAGLLKERLDECKYHKPIPSVEEGSCAIKRLLLSSAPSCILRMGATEAACCSFYHEHLKEKRAYPAALAMQMNSCTGFFPTTNQMLDEFAKNYLEYLKSADAIGLLRYGKENVLLKYYCPETDLIPFRSLEPWLSEAPWTSALAGKTVLVIHPFGQTIQQQFTNRELLFLDPRILPEFRLKTLKAAQTVSGTATKYKTWFEALEGMFEQIRHIDFEIAIIGAGAYGLPLAAYVKQIGRKAVHMGGATQLLFGIKGKRWDNDPLRGKLYNKHWVRPTSEETPPAFQAVEGGCYW